MLKDIVILSREYKAHKKESIYSFFNSGNIRSVRIKKNIVGSLILYVVGMVIGFVQVPIMLKYLEPTNYGIWVTIGSIITFLNFFDVGLSNGLRNKFAEAMAANDKVLAKHYVSTTYVLISLIMLITYLLFLILLPIINWCAFLNTSTEMMPEINAVVFIVFSSSIITFVLQIIRTILVASQRPAFGELIKTSAGVFTLIAIIILSKTTRGSLLFVSISFGLIPIVVYLIFSASLFTTIFKEFIPTIKSFKVKYVKSLFSLGIKFFLIQFSAMILYSSDNIIISQVLGPSHVTTYAITFKYFWAISLLYSLIAFPFWSGFTDAYCKGDIQWIKNSIHKLRLISILFSVVVVLMICASNVFYKMWIGTTIHIPFHLTLLFGVNTIMMMVLTPYVNFINGIGIITLQLVVGVIDAIIHVPISIIFIKYFSMDTSGVILATCLATCVTLFLWPVQYKKLINKNAMGIWAR